MTSPLKVLSLVLGLASLLALLEPGWPTSIDLIPARAQAEVDGALRLAVTEDTWYYDAETGPLRPGMDESPAGADPILRVDSSNHSPQLAATVMKFEAIPDRMPLEDTPIRFDVTEILRHIGPHGIALYIEYISRSTTTCMLHDRQTEFPASLVIETPGLPRTLLLPSLRR